MKSQKNEIARLQLLLKQGVSKVDSDSQTELEPLVAMACEILLHELMTSCNESDNDLMKRIRAMVERVLAKCRQQGCSLAGLNGTQLGQPTKLKPLAGQKEAHHKSWHFTVNEPKRCSPRIIETQSSLTGLQARITDKVSQV